MQVRITFCWIFDKRGRQKQEHVEYCRGKPNDIMHSELQLSAVITWSNIISYPLFADADTGIYPHAASQYHAWPKAKRGIAMLSTRLYRSGKESGQRSESPLWRHQWRSFVFISHADDVKRETRLHISRLLTNQKRESAQSMG